MWNIKTLTIFVILLALPLVYGVTSGIKSFSNNKYVETLTFSGNQSILRYLDVYRFYSVYNLSINISTSDVKTFCIQEFSNRTSACGGNSTGNYTFELYDQWTNPNLIIDGAIDTHGTTGGATKDFDIYYEKPVNKTGAVWQVVVSNAGADRHLENITIPTACYNFYTDKIHLKLRIASGDVYSYCVTDVVNSLVTWGQSDINEETIFWNTSGLPYKPSVQITNNTIWSDSYENYINTTASISGSYIEDRANKCNCNNCSLVGDYCRMPFTFHSGNGGKITYSNITIGYYKQFHIIDEKLNTYFDVTNITDVKLYSDNNNSVIDLQALGTARSNVSLDYDKYRLELTYTDGTIITRYIDTSLVDGTVRICANRDGTTHYEQLLISTTEKAALLKSIYANCYIAADYTRFGYQNSYVLKAYSIDTQYSLSTIDEGQSVLLIGLDGSIASYVNLDTLQFRQESTGFSIPGDSLAFYRSGDTTIQIRYTNSGAPNTAVTLSVTRTDTNKQLLSTSDFTNYDDITTYYDFSTETGVNDTTIFKIELEHTNADGTETLKRYFSTTAKVGFIKAQVALAISFFIILFSLTLTISRVAFSWFGIFGMLASLFILSMAVTTWYITFMFAINIVLTVYIVLVMVNQNQGTLAG